MPRPRAVLFDLGNTLWTEREFDLERGTRAVLSLASSNPKRVTAAEVRALLEEIEQDFFARREASWLEISAYSVHRHIYEPWGITFDLPFHEVELAFWQAATRISLVEGALEAVDRVSDLNLPSGVVSNSAFTGATLAWQLDQLGLSDRFAFVMSSADYVVRKPHPLIFATAARKLGVPAEQVWFVGDSLDHDVQGAKAAGMTAIWLNTRGETPRIVPDHEISAWSAFGSLLAPHSN